MTEIKIEKKKPVLVWAVLAFVVVAGLIYFYSQKKESDQQLADKTDNTEQTAPLEKNATVASFVSFVNDDANKMGLDHAYTNNALLKLSDAIEAKAKDVSYDVKADVTKAKMYANKFTDPIETTHANNITKANDNVSTSLAIMQHAKFIS